MAPSVIDQHPCFCSFIARKQLILFLTRFTVSIRCTKPHYNMKPGHIFNLYLNKRYISHTYVMITAARDVSRYLAHVVFISELYPCWANALLRWASFSGTAVLLLAEGDAGCHCNVTPQAATVSQLLASVLMRVCSLLQTWLFATRWLLALTKATQSPRTWLLPNTAADAGWVSAVDAREGSIYSTGHLVQGFFPPTKKHSVQMPHRTHAVLQFVHTNTRDM